MKLSRHQGKLVLIGGREDKEEDPVILAEFVRLAGGSKAHIAVMTAATQMPEEVGANYVNAFVRLGAGEVYIVDVSSREDARNPESLDRITKATGVFFTGGTQLYITALIGGTEMDQLLHDRSMQGVVFGGTSAGAAMMSGSMIIEGGSYDTPRFGNVMLGPGMEFLNGAIIDTHFSQRGRHGRLLAAVAQYPHDLGIGIDENTALVVSNSHFDVVGSGSVTVIDAGASTYTNVANLREGEGIALFDVRVHVLPAGYRFDLRARQPEIPATVGS